MKKTTLIIMLLGLCSCNDSSSEVIEKYSNGETKLERQYLSSNDKSYYLVTEFHENGRIKLNCKIKNGELVEFRKSFYENGNLREHVQLSHPSNPRNCCPDGYYEKHSENGLLLETHSKSNDLYDGLLTRYDSSGIKVEEIEIKADQRNGITRGFYSNGQIEFIREFSKDTLINTAYYFYENGDSLKTYNTRKGKVSFPIKYWNNDKSGLYGDYLTNNEKLVKWEWFDSTGVISKSVVVDTVDGTFTTPDF